MCVNAHTCVCMCERKHTVNMRDITYPCLCVITFLLCLSKPACLHMHGPVGQACSFQKIKPCVPPAVIGIWNVVCWASLVFTTQLGGNDLHDPVPASAPSQPHLRLVGALSSPPFSSSPITGAHSVPLASIWTVGKVNRTETLGKTSSPKSLLIFREN